MVLVRVRKQRDRGTTYSFDTTWVRVDAWRYMHRHHRVALAIEKVWRTAREGSKTYSTDCGEIHQIYRWQCWALGIAGPNSEDGTIQTL